MFNVHVHVHRKTCVLIACCLLLATTVIPGGVTAAAGATDAPGFPAWPDDGTAQRDLANGSIMFVENDHGTWRAWVLSQSRDDRVEALDFFSGKRMKVRVALEGGGYQKTEFTESNGTVHRAAPTVSLRFKDERPGGEVYGIQLNRDSLRLNAADRRCFVSLDISVRADGARGSWRRLPITHSHAAKNGCPSGDWKSLIHTALELGDGSFLATTDCRVFRLRASDLSPVGNAPALRVVDASVVEAALAQASGRDIRDATAWLGESLGLPMDEPEPCMESE